MICQLLLLLLLLLLLPLSACDFLDVPDFDLPKEPVFPNNYYKAGDYLIGTVIPSKALIFLNPDFTYDPFVDYVT